MCGEKKQINQETAIKDPLRFIENSDMLATFL